MANIKAAASGIHGAGETLRGTFNDTFDRRNPTAHAKNQAVIDKGRAEIEASRMRQQQAHGYQQSTAAGGITPVSTGAAPSVPPPGPGRQPYNGPAVSGSQIEGGSGTGRGKLSNIMKKMKEGPTRPDGSVQAQH